MPGFLTIAFCLTYLGSGDAHSLSTGDPCLVTFTVVSKAELSVSAGRWKISARPILIGCEADLRRLDAAARAKLASVLEEQLESLGFLSLALNNQREVRKRRIVEHLNAVLGADLIADVYFANLSGTEYEPRRPDKQPSPDGTNSHGPS